jgi:hypothetical protein
VLFGSKSSLIFQANAAAGKFAHLLFYQNERRTVSSK